ncbi:fibronectin type III domain-containing protein [Maioricimonas rarisocia]|uniref:fibronectin type III domain-containing protein n=1 Tax=Maioricimonas rarisocia TaxID=2528026 RepID=UPI0011A4C988|nr:fibronectin type III domain-containing protein [Maioricimonas rarisocia]
MTRQFSKQLHACRHAVLCWLLLAAMPPMLQADDPPAAPGSLSAVDHPNDVGNAIDLTWEPSPDDRPDVKPPRVIQYVIFRQEVDGDGEWLPVGEQTYGTTTYSDKQVERGHSYLYRVVAVSPEGARSQPAATTEPATPTMQWFRKDRAWFAIIVVFVCGSVVLFISLAKRGHDLYVRPIPGLEAVDEAVGRATEMGRECLFVPGIQDINDIQTVAGLTVLGRVATHIAEYDADLDVPTARSLVMTAARETVEASYLSAGRPDSFNEDDIYYLTDEQFGYVAGVTGKMVRDKPAACFYMGAFYAESLLLAETGNAVGAIQVAGTAMPSQLPFFVAACDYTLIGEEFFAASAYLSGEPFQLGTLRGQDVGKLLGGALLLVGCTVMTIAVFNPDGTAAAIAGFIKNHILGGAGFLP